VFKARAPRPLGSAAELALEQFGCEGLEWRGDAEGLDVGRKAGLRVGRTLRDLCGPEVAEALDELGGRGGGMVCVEASFPLERARCWGFIFGLTSLLRGGLRRSLNLRRASGCQVFVRARRGSGS
jgi:hypothetical protein